MERMALEKLGTSRPLTKSFLGKVSPILLIYIVLKDGNYG